MKQALGLVEISGLSTAVVVADTMVKAANVRILEIENTKGLGYMTVKVVGDVGAVNAAVNAGKQIGTANGKLVSWKVIPRPSDYVDQTFCCPDPPVPPSPPKKEAQEETEAEAEAEAEVEAEVEAKAETAAEAPAGELGESEETEPNATEPEQETEAEPAENAAEPAEAKTEPKIEAELTEAETTEPAQQEVPDSPETPPEKPKKTAKRTTAEKSTGTTRRKKN
ncbi:BMC domain-containing protein [Enterocloster citroniae]|uniref:BMC domain-containing protein n=1 Tax=Enterocloster citroniae TaxID=358743 RepID=UPI001D072259|nr:BMC domain-containing protein [Enterocloster citroniae]MCB7063671.1 BMC domain-containing protein [Enterocloster citroniae]